MLIDHNNEPYYTVACNHSFLSSLLILQLLKLACTYLQIPKKSVDQLWSLLYSRLQDGSLLQFLSLVISSQLIRYFIRISKVLPPIIGWFRGYIQTFCMTDNHHAKPCTCQSSTCNTSIRTVYSNTAITITCCFQIEMSGTK